jgi:hypothetical protein
MYRRNRTPEVRALLWEIARLQTIVRRADQLLACFPASAGTSTASALEIVLGALRRELAGEPCLEEDRRRRAEEECQSGWPRKIHGRPSARAGAGAMPDDRQDRKDVRELQAHTAGAAARRVGIGPPVPRRPV